MQIESFNTFLSNPELMLATVSSVLSAILMLVLWKKHNKTWLLYAHLFFILAPLFLFAIKINCGMGIVHGLLSLCTIVITKFLLYVLPVIIALTITTGYIVIPYVYKHTAKHFETKQFVKLCNSTGIKAELFIIDKAKPIAFSIKRKIFLSVGMFETLSKKEIEAVLLHELAHVKARSAWNKFSTHIINIFSPIAWFAGQNAIEREERNADVFAQKIQGTEKFLEKAKKKINDFC